MRFDPTHPLFRKLAYLVGAGFLGGSIALVIAAVVNAL